MGRVVRLSMLCHTTSPDSTCAEELPRVNRLASEIHGALTQPLCSIILDSGQEEGIWFSPFSHWRKQEGRKCSTSLKDKVFKKPQGLLKPSFVQAFTFHRALSHILSLATSAVSQMGITVHI